MGPHVGDGFESPYGEYEVADEEVGDDADDTGEDEDGNVGRVETYVWYGDAHVE